MPNNASKTCTVTENFISAIIQTEFKRN